MRVVIADDNAVMREKMKDIVAMDSALELITVVGDGQGAINIARREKPDIFLMDTNMPGTDGIWATRVIRRELPQIKVIALAVLEDEANMAVEAGASGCFFKNRPEEELLELIHTVLVDEEEVESSNRESKQAVGIESVNEVKLTKREKDILRLVAEGKNNKQIAEILMISEKTVKNHLTSIFRKLNVRDRTQAALYVLKNGIV
ncbi:response regulator transcription factor [Thermosyntropha sp.]|uniref:response regulator transcription factor n=1 Tax=Thermosyntropha sp. TaxID=2740820 RepID=UPI0025F0BD6A|nr:response regulator transcription factor [Thermosyntropha sp.]